MGKKVKTFEEFTDEETAKYEIKKKEIEDMKDLESGMGSEKSEDSDEN